MKFVCSIKGQALTDIKSYGRLYDRNIEADNAYEALLKLAKDSEFDNYNDKGNIYSITIYKIGG